MDLALMRFFHFLCDTKVLVPLILVIEVYIDGARLEPGDSHP